MLRLKELREDNDYSQLQISKLLGISQTNYSKYELEKINYKAKKELRKSLRRLS